MLNVDIDTGGTMTDGLVSGDGHLGFAASSRKVETTPHDVTISFLEILEAAQAPDSVSADLATFLDQVALIRWSSTITSNVLAQRSGPSSACSSVPVTSRPLQAPTRPATVIGSLVAGQDITGIAADAAEYDVRVAVKALLRPGYPTHQRQPGRARSPTAAPSERNRRR